MLVADPSMRHRKLDPDWACVPGLLSVVVPVYNEIASLRTLLARIEASPLEKEIVVVDDGSDDGTHAVLQSLASDRMTVIAHQRNYGKGAAIRTALEFARGEFVIIQDGDLEYDPADYPRLLRPLQTGDCDVVYGVRPDRPERGYRFHWGAKVLTWITNALYGAHLHDEATCYKAFRRALLDQLALECVRFEFCPEVTGKLLRLRHRIIEVPISYHPRRRADGKKLTVADGASAVLTLLRVRCIRRRRLTSVQPSRPGSLFPRTVITLGRAQCGWPAKGSLAPHVLSRDERSGLVETRNQCGTGELMSGATALSHARPRPVSQSARRRVLNQADPGLCA
jgi:dolichol-phosphate mannosyltransferase